MSDFLKIPGELPGQPSFRTFAVTLALLYACVLALILYCALSGSPAHAANVIATVTPQDVIVHFVGPQQFALACPKDTLACAVTGRPCQIWLPSGARLWGNPETQYAGFADPMTVAELAHELEHCILGAWHPE